MWIQFDDTFWIRANFIVSLSKPDDKSILIRTVEGRYIEKWICPIERDERYMELKEFLRIGLRL